MSRTIDEKVVEMRFDNSDFERNVSHSMSTLDKLKGALNFSGMEKAFDGITSAANKINFGPLGGAIDGVGQKFSALETMAVGALMNIGATIESKLVNTLKSVSIDQITAGFDKYAEKTTAVQTIMNATGKEIDEVSEKLETLNWFTDETSYNFTDMTSNIGKFTSQRVALDDAVVAMEGISTAAALAGQNAASASRVMYNFSQALGMGSVQVRDWMSVENANMATDEFKQTIIDTAVELGKLDKYGNFNFEVGKGYTGPDYVNALNFRETLAADWFDSEVLIESLKKFGGFSNRLNEVYDQFNENYDVTTSQILTWLDEYMNGTLNIEDAVKKTGLAAEEILPILEELSSEEYDLGRRAFKAAQEAKTFEDVVNATADAVSTAWMNVFEKIFGNYEEARVTWTQLANELWDIFAGPISNLNDLLTDWHDMGGRDDFIQSIKNMYHAVRSFLDPIGEAWSEIFPPKTADDIFNFTKRLKDFSESLILDETRVNQIRMVFEDFFGIIGTFSTAFKDGGGFGKFFEGIGGILKKGTDRIYNFMLGIQRIRSVIADYESGNLGEFSFVQQTIDAYPAAAKALDIYEKLVKTAETLGQTFGKLFDVTKFFKDGAITIESIIDGIKENIANVLSAITELVHIWTGTDIGKTIGNIRAILFDLFDGVKAFLGSERWSDVKYAINGIANAFKDTFGPAWQAAVAIFDDWIAGIRTLISGADGDFNGFFDTIARGAYWVADFVRSWKGGVEFISEFLTKFLSLTDAIEVYRANGGGILGVLAVINDKLRIILDTVADLIQNVTGFDVHGIGDSILGVIQSIGYAILQVADTISKAFGWTDNPFGKLLGSINEGFGGGPEGNGIDISGIFDRIGDAFSRLGELINKVAPGVSVLLATVGDAFKNLWELIGQIRLEDLIRIFQGIASIMLMFQGKKTLAELGDTLEAYQKKLKADMLFAIAGSILMIAGAALMISKIDAEKIGLVLGTLGVSFAGLIGMMIASKWADPKALAALPGTVLAIAASMVILAKAAEMMTAPIQAFADMENFWSGMGKLSTVMASFLVLLGILGGINIAGNGGAVLGAAKALGKLAGVLAIMLPIVLVYSKIDWMKFGDGLAKAALGIVAIGGALGLVSEMEKHTTSISHKADFMSLAKSLLVLSAAIGVLTAVMFALTKLDPGEYFASLGKMLGILAVAAGGVWLFSKALTAFGETMFILDKTGAMKALDRFSTVLVKLGTALLMLTVGTLGLGLIAKLLGDSAQEIAEAGVNLIVVVLDAIVARTPEIAEDIVLFILGVLDAVADHTPEIVSACIRIIGGIAEGVKEAMTTGGIDIGELLGGGGLLAGILGIVFLLKKAKLGVNDFFNAGLALIGAAALLVEIGALFYGMGQLSDLVGGPAGLEKFAKFGEALTSALMGNKGGVLIMVLSLLTMVGVMSAVIGKLELKEKDMASSIGKAFLVLGQVLGEVVVLLDVIGLLFAATGALLGTWSIQWIEKAGDFFDAIIGIFVGEDEGGGTHAKGGLIGLFVAFGAILGVLSALNIKGGSAAVWGAFGTVWSAVVALVAIIDTIGVLFAATGGVVEGLNWVVSLGGNYDNDIIEWVNVAGDFLEAISVAIGKFAGGFVGGAIQGISENVTEQAVSVVKAMAEVMVAMSEAGLLANLSLFTGGPIGLAAMMSEFGTMGPYFKQFADGIKDIPEDLANKAAVCATALAALIGAVPTTGGVPAFFKGEKDLTAFGAGLVLIAAGLKGYAETIVGMTEDDLASLDSRSVLIGDIIETVCSAIPTTNKGWKWFTDGDNDIGTFGTRLESFGLSLVEYSKSVSGDSVKIVAMNNVAGAITKICEYAKSVADLGGEGVARLGTFGNNLSTFGAYFKDYYDSLKDIKIEKVDSISGAVNRMIKSFVGTDDTSTASTVASLTGDFLNKLVTAFGSNDTKKKSDEAADKFIDYFRDRFLWDGTIGKITLAMQNMINKSVYDEAFISGLAPGGKSIVEEIQNGITEAFEGEEGLIAKFTALLNTLATGIATDGQSGSKKQYYDAGAALVGALRNGMVNEETVSGFGTPPAKQLKEDFKGLLDSLIGLIVSEETKGQFQRGGASLINSMIGGMKSVDIAKEANDFGGNAAKGVSQGVTDNLNVVQDAVQQVVNTVKTPFTNPVSKGGAEIRSPSRLTALYGWYLDGGLSDGLIDGIPMVVSAIGTVVDETKEAFTKSPEQGGFGIHSNSWLMTLFGRFLDGGVADGVIDGIPGIRDAIAKVKQAITDEMGLNDLMNLLHDNGLGALENTFADYIKQFGADFSLEGMMGDFDIQGQLDEFQNEYMSNMSSFNNEYTSFMNDTSTDGMEALTASYSDNSYVTDGVSTLMNNTSDAFGSYNDMMGTQGTEGTYSFYNNIGDSAMSAAESITPTVTSASQMVADAATAPIEDGIVEILSYVDWLKEAYPEGLTEAFSTPVFDFTELYENMGGGQLEAILNSFDALDEAGRKNLIRAYGLGEQGGNEDLANYLTWYWKNEPVRLKNEEAIAQAQAGYQTYLEEQKALQEAQAIQNQKNYEGVQQIAGDMQAHTDEFNAKYMAVVEEIKMTVLSIQEELNGVHTDIEELNNMDVYIDSNALVGATAEKYNEELGNMAKIGRRNVTR